jgi:signal transduction histidine kinase
VLLWGYLVEISGKKLKVFCLYEKQHELESFLNSALAQTQMQRYLIRFFRLTKSPPRLSPSIMNGFEITNIKVPQKITSKWKKNDFVPNLEAFLTNFPEGSTRQNFFLDFSAIKVTKSLVNFVEATLEDMISNHGITYSIFSLFLENNLGKISTQLAFNYPFLCLTDSHIHPNFYYEEKKTGKFPGTLRDLYQPIQLLMEELEKNSLENNRLYKELFLLSTHSNVIESSLATFLEMEREQIGSGRKSVPADLISLSDYRNLKQRYDEKTQMLSAVSHDLKSPIAAIQGFAEILRDGLVGEVTQEMKKHLEMIVANSKRLSRMVESIMEMESLDRSEYFEERQTFDLIEMIDDAKMSVLPQMIQKDQEIRLYTPESLEMVGNRELLLRALQNILDNAVKYSPPKKGQIDLFAEEEHVKGRNVVKITVKDNGYGFNKKNLRRVFEPFTKFEPGSTSTGLGLSIVKKIIELIHDGSIEITSPGRKKGTTVTILLPKT